MASRKCSFRPWLGDPSCETYAASRFNRENPPLVFVLSDVHLTHLPADGCLPEREKHAARICDVLDQFLSVWRCSRLKLVEPILVLLGDIFDDWAQPLEEQPHSLEEVIQSNSWFVQKLDDLVNEGFVVVYVKGNHDMSLKREWFFRTMYAEEEEYALPASSHLFQKVRYGGERLVFGDVVLEHGHRYDTSNTTRFGDVAFGQYPIGYFTTRIAASSGLTDVPPILKKLASRPGTFILDRVAFPRSGLTDQTIKTSMNRAVEPTEMIILPDGSSVQVSEVASHFRPHLMSMPTDALLGGGVGSDSTPMLVPMFCHDRGFGSPTTEQLTMTMAGAGFLEPFAKRYFPFFRIVVFGHSHDAKVVPCQVDGGGHLKTYYVNSGVANAHFPEVDYVVIHLSASGSIHQCKLLSELEGEGEIEGEGVWKVEEKSRGYNDQPLPDPKRYFHGNRNGLYKVKRRIQDMTGSSLCFLYDWAQHDALNATTTRQMQCRCDYPLRPRLATTFDEIAKCHLNSKNLIWERRVVSEDEPDTLAECDKQTIRDVIQYLGFDHSEQDLSEDFALKLRNDFLQSQLLLFGSQEQAGEEGD